MARKSDFVGDRYGDWFVESKAPAKDGKLRWHCVNTVTDERRLVLQTDLPKLTDDTHEAVPAEVQSAYVLEANVPSSAEITARVLIANYKDDLFGIPDGVLPEVDDDALTVEFVEPLIVTDNGLVLAANVGCVVPDYENPFDVQMSAGFFDDDESGGGCGDEACSGQCELDSLVELIRIEADASELTRDDSPPAGGIRRNQINSVDVTGINPWENASRKAMLSIAEELERISQAMGRIADALR